MGMEDLADERNGQFNDFQINDELILSSSADPMIMHCLPAYRGKEITEEVFEKNADIIFNQAENRLHAQKAIMKSLVDTTS